MSDCRDEEQILFYDQILFGYFYTSKQWPSRYVPYFVYILY